MTVQNLEQRLAPYSAGTPESEALGAGADCPAWCDQVNYVGAERHLHERLRRWTAEPASTEHGDGDQIQVSLIDERDGSPVHVWIKVENGGDLMTVADAVRVAREILALAEAVGLDGLDA